MWNSGVDYVQGNGWYRPKPAAGGAPTTLNPSDKAGTVALSNGNLTATGSGAGNVRSISSYSTGKYYCEVTATAAFASYDHALGIANSTASLTAGPGSPDTNSIALYLGDPLLYIAGAAGPSTGITYSTGDVIGMAIDMGNSKAWFRKNGGLWNSSGTDDPATNTGGISIAAVSKAWFVLISTVNAGVATANFGATAYGTSAPSGFGNW